MFIQKYLLWMPCCILIFHFVSDELIYVRILLLIARVFLNKHYDIEKYFAYKKGVIEEKEHTSLL